jgi:hypothetical protein
MRASMTAGSQTQSLQCGSGRLVPETDQEVRTKDSGAREPRDSSLASACPFRFKYPQPRLRCALRPRHAEKAS